MHAESKKEVKYEAPRLQTYGKLQTLTKGGGTSVTDGATTFKVTP